MRLILAAMALFCLGSCTLSMIMTDTHGTASDVVDSAPTSTADVKPVIEVPLTIPLTPTI